jgi:broad specificity phosphatase PhoE
LRCGCPGGETPAQLSDRADPLINGLDRLAGCVALFSHGHVPCILGTRWIRSAVSKGENLTLCIAPLSILGLPPSHPAAGAIMRRNATAAALPQRG